MESKTMFILPLQEKSLVCQVLNGEIKTIGSVPASKHTKAVVVNNELVCSIDQNIKLHNLQGELIQEIACEFSPMSLNVQDKVVYIGGELRGRREGGEIFALLDLHQADYKLDHIKLPIDISYGKSIDDVLILGQKLILVDNVIYPKFLLEYDISQPAKPKHLLTRELENNGTNEHILKGEVNEDWLILFSTTASRGGSSDHINIEGKRSGRLSVRRLRSPNDEKEKTTQERFTDICLIGHNLYIILNKQIVWLDLNGEISKDKLKSLACSIKEVRSILKTPGNNLIAIGDGDKYEFVK